MTGQDFPKLEAVVSVGRDNNDRSRRVGGGKALQNVPAVMRATSRRVTRCSAPEEGVAGFVSV